MTHNITFASQDLLQQYDIVATHFFYTILHMDYSECLVTDESWLSDYSNVVLTDAMYHAIADQYDRADKKGLLYTQTANLYHQIQKDYLFKLLEPKIFNTYGVHIAELSMPLWEIFSLIMEKNNYLVLEAETKSFLPIEKEPEDEAEQERFKNLLKNEKKLEDMTSEELNHLIDTTTNRPGLLVKYRNMTWTEAMATLRARQDANFTVYEAYRPDYLLH